MKNWLLYILCFFCCTSLWSQVTVTTTLGAPPYKSGQPIQMRVTIQHPPGVEITEFTSEQILNEFRIVDEPNDFKVGQNGNRTILQKNITIAPKFYGEMMLSAVIVGYKLNGEEKIAASKYKKVVVENSGGGEPENTSVTPIDEGVAMMNQMMAGINNKSKNDIAASQGQGMVGSDPTANPYGEIKDLKPIIEEPLKLSDFLPYLLAILALVGITFGIYYFLNKRNEPEPAPEPEVWIPAHKMAMEDLQNLKGKQLWQNGEVKQYQTELTRIIRQYLENRFEINALEMTSDDIVYHLNKKTSVSAPQQQKVKDILQIADLVKFAKANPPVNINEQFWNDADNFIKETKTDEIPAAFTAKQEAIQAEYEARIANSKTSNKRNKTT